MRLLLEGPPGVGKTTVVRRVAELLGDAGMAIAGFVTEEIREEGRRVGFALEELGGRRKVLAHVDFPGPPRVGKYGVDLEVMEALAIPALAGAGRDHAVVIDELGKMELASESFREAVSESLACPGPWIATVQAARHPFTDALKHRSDVEVVRVTRANRDQLPEQVAARLGRAPKP
jgi:nucleoside-triphosphatase